MPTTSQWRSSTRRAQLPRNWPAIRRVILKRDPTCRLRYAEVCTLTSTEVDHIGDPHNHAVHNLRGVCHACHAKRTQEQARDAVRRRARAPETHPGVTAP